MVERVISIDEVRRSNRLVSFRGKTCVCVNVTKKGTHAPLVEPLHNRSRGPMVRHPLDSGGKTVQFCPGLLSGSSEVVKRAAMRLQSLGFAGSNPVFRMLFSQFL